MKTRTFEDIPDKDKTRLEKIVKQKWKKKPVDVWLKEIDDIKKCLDEDRIPKKERAYFVYLYLKMNPEINVTRACYHFGVSMTFFRNERAIHKAEYDNHFENSKHLIISDYFIEGEPEDFPF